MTQNEAQPPRPMRPLVRAGGMALLSLVLVVGIWGLGFLWFVATLPDHVEDESSHTDAIVVLTGGSERLTTGIALLREGRAERLFVSGVHRGVDLPDLLKLVRAEEPDLTGAIELGHAADDTVGNALETSQWVERQHLSSLRLVTGAYHMPRSLAEFHHAMPEVTIIPHPVFPDTVKREWWRWPGTAALLATEYSKYLAVEIRHVLLPRKANP